MSFRSADELGQLLVYLRLVESSQLDECKARLSLSGDGPADLLRVMESKHFLTPYQVSRLEKGELDGLVLGNYKLMYKNGSGSFARVFRACSLNDGRMFGLKVLRERWVKDRKTVVQFHREAELCKKLRHKNIVPIYEVGCQNDYHYLTMEFIVGGNLRDFINIRKMLSPVEATRYILDMCEGLRYALSMGITHRDLKMTNVLMSSHGVAKLVDFGLAGDEGGGNRSSSPPRALEYATLEKWTNALENDPRTDLFFLGAIYYELLTGTPPYPRTRDREERKQFSRYANIRPLCSRNPNIPRVVEQLVERLMATNPNVRYQSPTEVIGDLRTALDVLPELSETSSEPAQQSPPKQPAVSQRPLPTIMCIESRIQQQDILREYLSKRGFRVLVLSDLERGLSRLKNTPPDCVVLMGESIGDDVVRGFQQAANLNHSRSIVTVVVLAERQADRMREMEQTGTARVLIQPITLRDLRCEIHLAFQQRLKDAKKFDSPHADAS